MVHGVDRRRRRRTEQNRSLMRSARVLVADEQVLAVLSGGDERVQDQRVGRRPHDADDGAGQREIEVDAARP